MPDHPDHQDNETRSPLWRAIKKVQDAAIVYSAAQFIHRAYADQYAHGKCSQAELVQASVAEAEAKSLLDYAVAETRNVHRASGRSFISGPPA